MKSTGNFLARVLLKFRPNREYVNSIERLAQYCVAPRDRNSDTKISLKTCSLFQSRGLACAVTSLLIVTVNGEKKIDGREKYIAVKAHSAKTPRAISTR